MKECNGDYWHEIIQTFESKGSERKFPAGEWTFASAETLTKSDPLCQAQGGERSPTTNS